MRLMCPHCFDYLQEYTKNAYMYDVNTFSVDGLCQYDAMMPPVTSWLSTFFGNEYQRMCSTNKEALKAYFTWGQGHCGWNVISFRDSVTDVKSKGQAILSVFKSLQCFMLLNKQNAINSIVTDGIHEVCIPV